MKKTLPEHADYGTVEEMGLFLPQKKKYTMRDFNNLVKAGWDHISARWIVVCSWAKYTGDNCDKCDITQKILTGKFLEQCKIKDMFA